VQGFKSIIDPVSLQLGRLTVLAGANSSGKSSILQPLLLLKQTLDATYDPGPLLINGPHVRFTSADQFMGKNGLHVELEIGSNLRLGLHFQRGEERGIKLTLMEFTSTEGKLGRLTEDMKPDEILLVIKPQLQRKGRISEKYDRFWKSFRWIVERDRCFLIPRSEGGEHFVRAFVGTGLSPSDGFSQIIRRVIHLPGLRGNPERTYPVTAIGDAYTGTFEKYVASVIVTWQDRTANELKLLMEDMRNLGLTWKVEAKVLDDTQVELKVGRLTRSRAGGARDLVSVADVGFGVSQVLPVLVALLVAEPGQLVLIEQPEIHLHPKAQVALVGVLARAAKRGVQVVIETHSSSLLLALQTEVATGKLDPGLVALHWFQRDENGKTSVTRAALDKHGAFGDWPEDFSETLLQQQSAYLDAAEGSHGQG
jgi:predicted ATPase